MWRRLACLLGFSLVAASAVAQPLARPTDYVALVYNDATIPDADRALLATFVAGAIPVEQWPTIQVTSPTRIECLIDDFYDYYYYKAPRAPGPFEAKLTVEALTTAIIRYNEGLSQSTVVPAASVRLPPFPVHAYHRGRRQTAHRIFDAEIRGYNVVDSEGEARPENAATAGIVGKAKCSSTTSALVTLPDRVADVVSTTIIVPALPAQVARLSELLSTPRHVLIFNTTIGSDDAASGQFKTGFSALELLGSDQPCTDGFSWLDSSPYFRYWTLKDFGGRLDTDALTVRAQADPLRVLDVGFTGGHGSQVVAVTRHLLEQLGLKRLAKNIDTVIDSWELVPSSQGSVSKALDILEQYGKEYPAGAFEFATHQENARAWIGLMTKVGKKFDVPDLVLGSMMWRTFKQGLWVNVSSRVRAPFLTDVVTGIVENSSGAVFAAVGNETKPFVTGYVPQDHSLRFANVISVTCGRRVGEICGEHGDSNGGDSTAARVLVAGPGCGFSGTSEMGSSLATPYVAVASWLAHLLAAAPAPGAPALTRKEQARFRRHDLVTANMPAPRLSHPVESHGLFDPAYLLLRPGPHMIGVDDTLTRIENYRVEYECADKARTSFAAPRPEPGEPSRRASETVLVFESDGVPNFWRRETRFDTAVLTRPCLLTSMTATITFEKNRVETFDLERFRKEIKWLTWTPYEWSDGQ